MSHGFYFRLARTNLRNHARTYLPYWLASSATVMMFFIITSLSKDGGLKRMRGGEMLQSMLLLGVWIAALFALIFLFYTNSFLMKRRKKEFGLYNILGMEKKHIARVMAIETLLVAAASLATGLLCGALLNKLCVLLVLQMLHQPVQFGFEFSLPSVGMTAALFGAIFLLTLLSNLFQIRLSNPVELLRAGDQGEREPKTKWVLAVIGVLCLGGGYALSILTKSPFEALTMFFLAVLLVIVGTYCLFTAGSIAALKLLRRNRAFYYRPNHFVPISGMIYRMKQNAVGLANICILSTMVLVTVSTTFSLYIGVGDMLLTRYPRQLALTANHAEPATLERLRQQAQAVLQEQELTPENEVAYTYLSFTGVDNGGELSMDSDSGYLASMEKLRLMLFLTLDDYNRIGGTDETLGGDEILIYANREPYLRETLSIFGRTFRVRKVLPQFHENGLSVANAASGYFIVVPDQETLDALELKAREALGERSSILHGYYAFDIAADEETQTALREKLKNGLDVGDVTIEGRAGEQEDFYSLYGGLFFLGIFLGLLFLLATVLIIYYKQISEGYDDKQRYVILQQVGMSREEVRRSIRSQVLIVFFLPLITAGIHVAFAFPLVSRMLSLFALTNLPLYGWCTAGCFLVFALFYAVVYALTARAYSRIVS